MFGSTSDKKIVRNIHQNFAVARKREGARQQCAGLFFHQSVFIMCICTAFTSMNYKHLKLFIVNYSHWNWGPSTKSNRKTSTTSKTMWPLKSNGLMTSSCLTSRAIQKPHPETAPICSQYMEARHRKSWRGTFCNPKAQTRMCIRYGWKLCSNLYWHTASDQNIINIVMRHVFARQLDSIIFFKHWIIDGENHLLQNWNIPNGHRWHQLYSSPLECFLPHEWLADPYCQNCLPQSRQTIAPLSDSKTSVGGWNVCQVICTFVRGRFRTERVRMMSNGFTNTWNDYRTWNKTRHIKSSAPCFRTLSGFLCLWCWIVATYVLVMSVIFLQPTKHENRYVEILWLVSLAGLKTTFATQHGCK